MILGKISASGLKGGPFSHNLAPATAIVGANAIGKTRILQAIRLVLAGWLPECGKTPKATWQLSSGAELVVTAEFDTGPNVFRRFFLEGATVKTETIITAHASKGHGKTDTVAMIENLDSLPSLNNEEYFGLTDTERTEYVFERIKLPDSYTPEGIVAELQRVSFGDEHSEAIEKAKASLVKQISTMFDGKLTIQEALTAEIEVLRESFTYWNRRSKDTQGAVTTLAELKARSREVAAAALGVEKELEELRELLGMRQTKLGSIQARQKESDRNAIRKAQIGEALDADRIDYTRRIAKLDEEMASVAKRLTELGDVEKIKVELERKRGVARDGLQTIADFELKIAAANDRRTKAEQRKTEVEKLDHCPWCKSHGEGWREQVLAELDSVIIDAAAAAHEGEVFLQGIQAGRKNLIAAIEVDAAAVEQATTLKLHQENLGRERSRAIVDDKDEEERRQRLRDELKGLPAAPEDLSGELAEVNELISDVRSKIGAAEFRKMTEDKLERELALAAKAEIEHIDAAAYVTVIKALAKVLKEKRSGMIEEAFTGLITIANKLTEGIMREPLSFHDNTIGMWIDGKFVSHKVFSGTEKALTYIAVAVALSSKAPLRLVLLDEFGRLDEDNQRRVIERLVDLVDEKVIDQFLVVGTELPETVPGDVKVIDL